MNNFDEINDKNSRYNQKIPTNEHEISFDHNAHFTLNLRKINLGKINRAEGKSNFENIGETRFP